jgi:serine/threonine protein kinase
MDYLDEKGSFGEINFSKKNNIIIASKKSINVDLQLENEYRCLRKLQQSSNIRLCTIYSSHQFIFNELVMSAELYYGQPYTLGDYVDNFEKNSHSSQELCSLLIRIILDIQKMHEQNICHYDLHYDNILITFSPKKTFSCQSMTIPTFNIEPIIIDFGNAYMEGNFLADLSFALKHVNFCYQPYKDLLFFLNSAKDLLFDLKCENIKLHSLYDMFVLLINENFNRTALNVKPKFFFFIIFNKEEQKYLNIIKYFIFLPLTEKKTLNKECIMNYQIMIKKKTKFLINTITLSSLKNIIFNNGKKPLKHAVIKYYCKNIAHLIETLLWNYIDIKTFEYNEKLYHNILNFLCNNYFEINE